MPRHSLSCPHIEHADKIGATHYNAQIDDVSTLMQHFVEGDLCQKDVCSSMEFPVGEKSVPNDVGGMGVAERICMQ